MQKNNCIIIVCICTLIICAIGGFFLGQSRGYNNAAGEFGARAESYLAELNGYKQREYARVLRAIERDRETEEGLRGLSEIGTGTSALLSQLRAEIGLLQNYYRDTRYDNSGGYNSNSDNGQ